MPTLIIWGAQDRWVPVADAFRLQGDIKGARLAIFEKPGHDPMEEDPKDTAAAVAAFLPTDAPAAISASPAGTVEQRPGRGAVGDPGEGLTHRVAPSEVEGSVRPAI